MVQRREVPKDTVLSAAFGLGLGLPSVLIHLFRNQVLVIPKVCNTAIGKTRKSGATGLTPVAEKDRLPNSKDLNIQIGIGVENLLDCGGPPQAPRSSRRQKHDQARLIGGLVELFLED
jgi:hypothetical protein